MYYPSSWKFFFVKLEQINNIFLLGLGPRCKNACCLRSSVPLKHKARCWRKNFNSAQKKLSPLPKGRTKLFSFTENVWGDLCSHARMLYKTVRFCQLGSFNEKTRGKKAHGSVPLLGWLKIRHMYIYSLLTCGWLWFAVSLKIKACHDYTYRGAILSLKICPSTMSSSLLLHLYLLHISFHNRPEISQWPINNTYEGGAGDRPLFVSNANKTKNSKVLKILKNRLFLPLEVFFLCLFRYFLKKCLVCLFYALFKCYLKAGV
jgi:hypothetical protein